MKFRIPNKKIQRFALLQLFITLFFTIIYWFALSLDNKHLPDDKKEDTNILDLFRYSLYTQTTVGYGDIDHLGSTYFKIANVFQLMSVLLSFFYY